MRRALQLIERASSKGLSKCGDFAVVVQVLIYETWLTDQQKPEGQDNLKRLKFRSLQFFISGS
eukprot:3222170-Rhodomonas_salina.1